MPININNFKFKWSLDKRKLNKEAIIFCLIKDFEADFLWKVSLKILHSGIILKAFTHVSLKIVLILANNADPDEMPPNAAFHLGLHRLPKYMFTSIQNEKGYLIKDCLLDGKQ